MDIRNKLSEFPDEVLADELQRWQEVQKHASQLVAAICKEQKRRKKLIKKTD